MFCGLGNPRSFRYTLESLGLQVVDRMEFDDHHRYRPRELRYLSESFQHAGAEAVVTTQKDSVNLCPEAISMLAPLPLFWLKVGMRITGEVELLALLEPALRRA
jgi:tetraacyldisaccharide 4'-kinase